jgi:hypothetical protein
MFRDFLLRVPVDFETASTTLYQITLALQTIFDGNYQQPARNAHEADPERFTQLRHVMGYVEIFDFPTKLKSLFADRLDV